MRYLVVLFKNKERKKIIKKFKTHKRAKEFFDTLLKENSQIEFYKEIENGILSKFEIGLLDTEPNEFDSYFVRDELGRQVKVDLKDSDGKILNISNYKIEELIFDLQKNKKISMINFIRNYIPKDGIKLISKLNNKVILQNDEIINLFSLKSDDDCYRFLNTVSDYMLRNKRFDTIIVSDDTNNQKKYLYSLLNSKGISKSFLYRKSTTYFSKK